MRHWIRSLPWYWQIVAWPLALPLLVLGWAAKEMFGQAKAGTKKILAPLLWPAVGILGLALLYGILGPRDFGTVFQLGLVLGMMALGLKLVVFGPRKPKKKGDKK